MIHDLLAGFALILLLGICAQCVAWRLGLPSILFLLTIGILVGPVFGVIRPEQILGPLLFPLVSVSVGILVFEGALNLRFSELRTVGNTVRNLLSIGACVTCLLTAIAARYILGFDWPLSLLLGTILIVTGPTVINPLLRSIRILPSTSAILRWEGIIIDSIGAIMAVLVYEALFASTGGFAAWLSLETLAKSVLIALLLGFLTAQLLLLLFRFGIIPEYLQSPSTLAGIIGGFTLSNIIQSESGLLTVTVMGLVMANQKQVAIKKITEFKESLQILLIAVVFIILSARVTLEELLAIRFPIILFVLTILFVARPLSVFLSCLKTNLHWKEMIFLSAIAPRGIVAAAISSLLALELSASSYPGSESLVTTVFAVIVVSVISTSILAKPLAHLLSLHMDEPQGLLLLGAHNWARELASVLQKEGISVVLVDTNPYNVYKARMSGLEVRYANILEEDTLGKLDLNAIGAFLALTPNDEVNSLAALSFVDILGKDKVYQLQALDPDDKKAQKLSVHKSLRGKQAFSGNLSFSQITALYAKGWTFQAVSINKHFSDKERYEKDFYPLMLCEEGRVCMYEPKHAPKLAHGQILISFGKKAIPAEAG